MKNKLIRFRPVILLFILINAFLFVSAALLNRWQVDRDVLFIGNLVLFLSSLISFLVALRGLTAINPHAFVRSVYTSIMLKFFICILSALVYIMTYRKDINKPALFTCMGLYLVYTFFEIAVLTKTLKLRSHAQKGSEG
jgi:hypothetical protein